MWNGAVIVINQEVAVVVNIVTSRANKTERDGDDVRTVETRKQRLVDILDFSTFPVLILLNSESHIYGSFESSMN